MNYTHLLSPSYFSDLQIKYFDKSFYTNKEIIKIQSKYVCDNPEINIITLPSIKGPIELLFKYLFGFTIKITSDDTIFFILMSQFLDFKDNQIQSAALSLLPKTPTIEMTDYFFKSQKSVSYDSKDFFKPYLNLLDSYFDQIKDAFIPYNAIKYLPSRAIKEKTAIKILKCLLNQLQNIEFSSDKYYEIERSIVHFVEKYPSIHVYKTILLCPYFDIRKIKEFKELLFDDYSKTIYSPSEKGFLEAREDDNYKDQNDYTVMYKYEKDGNPLNFKVIQKENPSFTFTFKSFTFDIQSYSIKVDQKLPYPITWSLFASKDLVNYVEIHHVKNSNIFSDLESSLIFYIKKPFTFARSIKFVLYKSSEYLGDDLDQVQLGEKFSTIGFKLFDFYGTSRPAFLYDNKNIFKTGDKSEASNSSDSYNYDNNYEYEEDEEDVHDYNDDGYDNGPNDDGYDNGPDDDGYE